MVEIQARNINYTGGVEINHSEPSNINLGIQKEARKTINVERKGTGYINLPRLDVTIDELYEDFKESHTKYKLVVQEVIEGWDIASNNDFCMAIEVLRALDLAEVTSGKDNFVIKIKRENLKNIPSFESLTRARRSLNAKGLCLPTDERVINMRKKREVAIRNYFGSLNQES